MYSLLVSKSNISDIIIIIIIIIIKIMIIIIKY